MIADADLWDDFRNGKRYALSHIYFTHVQFLLRFGRKFTKDEELIRDTIQEVFLALIKGREKLGTTHNIRYYLMAAFRHNIARNLVKQSHHPTLTLPSGLDFLVEESPEELFISKEELTDKEKALRKAFNLLPPKQKEILYYRYVCELDYEHICEMMSISYDTARKMVYRSIRQLKSTLKENKFIVAFLGFFHNEKKSE
ncbi:MAG: sigma-70 family RNA polymerase sigma factor [Marinilabiliales bacterium]|nr:sigma-70 family RNA polymerase sigma factor [Marinilabiliales bacterium]